MRSLISLIVLIAILVAMFAGQSIYQSDLEYNKTRDIYNLTESKFVWNSTVPDSIKYGKNNETNIYGYELNINRMKNIISEFIDFLGYSLFEIMKWSIEFGYQNPQYDFKFFMDLFIKIMILILIISLIPMIVPLAALIYLLFKGIYIGIKKIFEWILKDEEKQRKTKT